MVKLLAAILGLLAIALTGGIGQASAAITDVPCFGIPQDYRIANDMVDGVFDGEVRYPEARVFIESQSHIQESASVVMINEFEHLHVGGCFPYAEKWVQPPNARTFDARLVFHNNRNYNITNFGSTFVHNGGSGGGFTANATQKAQLETAMDNSANSTQTVFQSFTMGSNNTSCRKSFRPSLKTERANDLALVDFWEDAGQWTTYFDYPGQPVCTPEFAVDQLRARSWVQPNRGYIYTNIFDLPTASHMSDPLPSSGTLDFTVGVSGRAFQVYVDPDFHNPAGDNPGVWHKDFPALSQGTVNTQVHVSIPLADIPPGVHRVVVVSGGGFQAAIQVFPFKVAGAGC